MMRPTTYCPATAAYCTYSACMRSLAACTSANASAKPMLRRLPAGRAQRSAPCQHKSRHCRSADHQIAQSTPAGLQPAPPCCRKASRDQAACAC